MVNKKKRIIFFLILLLTFCKNSENENHFSELEILEKNFLKANSLNKKVLLIFGANWCIDCRTLDKFLNEKETISILEKSFIVQKVDVGNFEKNLDFAKSFNRNLEKTGIPNILIFNEKKNVLNPNIQEKIYSAKEINLDLVKDFLLRYK